MVLLNTSFFFIPQISQGVRVLLRTEWLPACQSCGSGEPVCLQMPDEPGVERLAIQTPFASRAEAEQFLNEVLAPIAGRITRQFGAEAFTAFSTIMDIIEL